MAPPWKNSETGTYYLRRQISAELRPAFGGKTLYKVALRTKGLTPLSRRLSEALAPICDWGWANMAEVAHVFADRET